MSAGVHICIHILSLCIIGRKEKGRRGQTLLFYIKLNFIYCGYMNVHRVFVQLLLEWDSLENWLVHPPWSRACCKRPLDTQWLVTQINYKLWIGSALVHHSNASLILSSASRTSCWARLSWKTSIVAVNRCPLPELGLSVGRGSTPALVAAVSRHCLHAALLCSCCALCTLHTGLCSCVGVLGQLFKDHVKHIRRVHSWFERTFPWWEVK